MAGRVVFHVFPSARLWCARRGDGLVCGNFVDQAGAIRFARRETCGAGAIIITNASVADTPLAMAA